MMRFEFPPLLMHSRCGQAYDPMNTFVKLPTGDVEIEHIREMVSEVKGQNFVFQKWHPRPGLRDKRSNFVTHLYTGQSFDERYFTLDNTGWTDDHCLICFQTLGPDPSQYNDTDGYFDGSDWVCRTCYTKLVLSEDLDKTLESYGHYSK
jgi:hypothetical protein